MNSRTDQDLLREYSERRSEAAFAELVRRHIDFVHSAALRMVKDPHLAEDVTQRVFAALVQQASQLADRAVLSGWLHRTTQNLAAKTVRTEVRRRAREQEAVAMNDSATQNEPAWEQVAPHLDAALGELNESDRDALLLRYFQRKTAREIADALGLNEEAAQKRVTRALEKLRGVFTARGVAISTSALAGLLAVQAVQTAPAALAASVATASLAATASTFTLLSLMASTKLQIGIAAVVAAGLVTPLVLQHQQLQQLRAESSALSEHARELESKVGNEQPAPQPATQDELARQQAEHLELLRLRGEITRLGNELKQRAASTQVLARATNEIAPVAPVNPPPARSAFKGFGVAKVGDGATFAVGGWSSAPGRRAFLFVTPSLPAELQPPAGGKAVLVRTRLVEFPEEDLSESLRRKLALVRGGGGPHEALSAAPVFLQNDPDFLGLKAREEFQGGTNINVVATPSVMTADGQQARVSVGQQVPALSAEGNIEYHFLGSLIDLVPRVAADGSGINVEATISFTPPEALQSSRR